MYPHPIKEQPLPNHNIQLPHRNPNTQQIQHGDNNTQKHHKTYPIAEDTNHVDRHMQTDCQYTCQLSDQFTALEIPVCDICAERRGVVRRGSFGRVWILGGAGGVGQRGQDVGLDCARSISGLAEGEEEEHCECDFQFPTIIKKTTKRRGNKEMRVEKRTWYIQLLIPTWTPSVEGFEAQCASAS
jgi:hypothetical protein